MCNINYYKRDINFSKLATYVVTSLKFVLFLSWEILAATKPTIWY